MRGHNLNPAVKQVPISGPHHAPVMRHSECPRSRPSTPLISGSIKQPHTRAASGLQANGGGRIRSNSLDKTTTIGRRSLHTNPVAKIESSREPSNEGPSLISCGKSTEKRHGNGLFSDTQLTCADGRSKTDVERIGCEKPIRPAKRHSVLTELSPAGPRQDGTMQARGFGSTRPDGAQLEPRGAFPQGGSS